MLMTSVTDQLPSVHEASVFVGVCLVQSEAVLFLFSHLFSLFVKYAIVEVF